MVVVENRMGRSPEAWMLCVLASFALLLGACGSGGEAEPPVSECEVGAEACACYGNGTCNEGLTCASSLCVSLTTGDPDMPTGADMPVADMPGATDMDRIQDMPASQDMKMPADQGMGEDMPEDMGADMEAPVDMSTQDMGTPDVGTPDMTMMVDMPVDQGMVEDMGPDMVVLPGCDDDGDGALKMNARCGGDDCDDSNPMRKPGLPEVCDEFDNNCNMQSNEGLDCSFLAHSRDALYRIDPFAKTLLKIADMPTGVGESIQDIDAHPNGTVFGVTNTEVKRFDPFAQPPSWTTVGALAPGGVGGPTDPNGMAIDQLGVAFVSSENQLYRVDLITGAATLVGNTGAFRSSGDLVVTGNNRLLMTSKDGVSDDQLVELDRATAAGVSLGTITGYDRIFALTYAWGKLWGLNSSGQLLELNPMNATPKLITTFTDTLGNTIVWYGAASTPSP